MGMTLAQKLIESHLLSGHMSPGEEVGLRVDQTLTQDATGTIVYLALDAMGVGKIHTELSVSYVDHNLLQTDSKNADDHSFLQSAARRFGVIYSPPGNGISHQVHRERFGIPGKTLVGSDSHTTTGGCLGMLSIGAGGMDVALAMAGRPFYIPMPRIWGIYLTGRLQPWVSGKDVILELLRRHSVTGATGRILEFFGPGVSTLDMSARATIANMSVDMGATAAVFPSDAVTLHYLAMQGREGDWTELGPDQDAAYDEVTELDLGSIEPLVACPHSPDNVMPASRLANVKISQVIVGSSTNGSYRDIMMAAAIVKDRQVHPEVSLEINPGSRQVLHNVSIMGGLLDLIRAGARVHQPGCLGCIGMGQVPATGTNSLRTMPRNYKGRSGLKEDRVFLCSPETAAASALAGRIVDPRTLGEQPQVTYPRRFSYSPHWLLYPEESHAGGELRLGPHIRPLPRFPELEEDLQAEVLLKLGDNVSTDLILPAGNKVLPFRSNIEAISTFVFEAVDPTFHQRAAEKSTGIVVAGENYGQGSSREHAALAPRYLGVRAKVAKSFARIHKANLVNFGIVPLEFSRHEDYDLIKEGDRLYIPSIRRALMEGTTQVVAHLGDVRIRLNLQLSRRQREILLAGGVLNWAKEG
jgi:aconitate hydratase